MTEFQPLALWNGMLLPLAEVRVPALDRGYLFGDSAYEVIRLYGGRPFLLADHEARLARSLRELGIPAPAGGLGAKIQRLAEASKLKDAGVYVQISRGEGPRAHVPPAGLQPNELMFIQELPPATRQRCDAGVSALVADDLRWGRCDIKSTNLLGNCLPAAEAKRRGYDDAVLVDGDGYVTEGAHATVFGVVGGALYTAPLSPRILPGITRAFVTFAAKKAGIQVTQEPLAVSHLGRLTEMFFTGTLSGIVPVIRLGAASKGESAIGDAPIGGAGGGDLVIGSGAPGPVTRKLQQLLAAAT